MYYGKLQEMKGSNVVPFLTVMSLPFPESARLAI